MKHSLFLKFCRFSEQDIKFTQRVTHSNLTEADDPKSLKTGKLLKVKIQTCTRKNTGRTGWNEGTQGTTIWQTMRGTHRLKYTGER